MKPAAPVTRTGIRGNLTGRAYNLDDTGIALRFHAPDRIFTTGKVFTTKARTAESPALVITEALAGGAAAKILAAEPYVDECPPTLQGLPNVAFVGVGEALRRTDILLLLVDHDRFKLIEREPFASKVLIDTRGLFR